MPLFINYAATVRTYILLGICDTVHTVYHVSAKLLDTLLYHDTEGI